jgi:signal transduction histidine kinase
MSAVNTELVRFNPRQKPPAWYQRLWPRTLVSRMIGMLVCALLLAEVISGVIWYKQYSVRNDAGLESAVRSLTQNMLSTYNFMSSLPRNYRYLVLQQQLELGGSQFFFSINSHPLQQQPIAKGSNATRALELAQSEVHNQLGNQLPTRVSLTAANQLRVFNAGVLMVDLPTGWARFGLVTAKGDQPVLVLQIALNKDEWLFIASPLPPPYDQLDVPLIGSRQIGFTLCSMLLAVLFGGWLIRRELRPLARLAQGAHQLNTQLDSPPLPEEGSAELVSATRAFNQMQDRLRAYLHNREILFTAISHDLKTPLTRLRLRVEVLGDPVLEQKLEQDLCDLEMMVKGALQSMKDTDIHENMEQINLKHLLEQLIDAHRPNVTLRGEPQRLLGRPLALKRCINNLVDNGLKYGHKVEISVDNYAEHTTLSFRDDGPGIPQDQRENVFKPYYRLQHEQQGNGLGLAIARGIARAHGGDITLYNHPCGGLIAVLRLRRYM